MLLDKSRDAERRCVAQYIGTRILGSEYQRITILSIDADTNLKQCLHKCVLQEVTVLIDLVIEAAIAMVGKSVDTHVVYCK